MPTNSSVTASLVAQNVPSDRQCIRNANDVVTVVQDFVSVQVSGSAGDPTSPNNSVANQALNIANTALAAAQALEAAQKQKRTSGLIAIPNGDSNFVFSFAPAMPDTDYDIQVTIYAGATGHPSAYYGYRILESSITTTGFTILFDNTPANSKAAIVVTQR